MSRLFLASVIAPLFVGACGNVPTNHLADAPEGSGSDAGGSHVDGSTAGGRAQITARDIDTGSNLVGAQVVWIDSDGPQVTVTDGSGVASAQVKDGGTVTVLGTTDGSFPFFATLYGVKSTDNIVLGDTVDTTDLGTFTVNFPGVAGAGDSYTVFGPCGESGGLGSATLSFDKSCSTDPMEIVVVDDNDGKQTFIDKPGVPFVSGGSVTLSGPFRPALTFVASITDAGSVTSVSVEHIAQGFEDAQLENGASATVSGGLATVSTAFPTTASAVADVRLTRPGFGQNEVFEKISGNSTTFGLDVGATALPWLGAASFDTATQTAHVVVDNTDSKGDASDAFFCVLLYTRPATGSDGQAQQFEWALFTDTVQDLVLPTLPGALATFQPQATDSIRVQCGALESDAIDSYDTVRQDFLKVLNDASNTSTITGTVRESSSVNNNTLR